MDVFKPMLAKDARLEKLSWPLLGQPKLDGIRCCIVNGRAVSRTLKPIPNAEIREYLEQPEFEGLDGELLVGDPTASDAYNTSVSFVMSRSKTGAAWRYYVFDAWNDTGDFLSRSLRLMETVEGNFGQDQFHGDTQTRITYVKSDPLSNPAALDLYEARLIDMGFEGVILRVPGSRYKFGRSGIRGPLLKLKRFADGEAEIIGVEEKMHNANEARTNELGRTERSTAKEGLVPTGTLGALVVRDLETGVEFKIGTGFDAKQREDFWRQHNEPVDPLGRPRIHQPLVGRTVKYKHFVVGAKDRPRFPVFLGFRDMELDG